MRRIGKKWRRVYPYICVNCGKSRVAYSFPRAIAKICRMCEPKPMNPDQAVLL